MADIFDQVTNDVFDQVAPSPSAGPKKSLKRIAFDAMRQMIPIPTALRGNRASEILAYPAEKLQQGMDMAISKIPDPESQSVAANVALGTPKALMELASPMVASMANPQDVAMGQVIGSGLGRMTMKAAPEAARLAKNAEEMALKLTPAELTKNKPLALIESGLEKLPFSAGIIQRFRNKQVTALENKAANLVGELGSQKSHELAGQEILKNAEKKFFQRKEVRDSLFDKLADVVPKDSIVNTPSLREAAERLLSKESQLPEHLQIGVAPLLQDLSKVRQEGLSFQGAKALRERFNQLIGRVADTPEKHIYKQLKDALGKDVESFASEAGGNITKTWSRANRYHGALKEHEAKIGNIKALAEKRPEAVVGSIFKPGAVTDIRLLRRSMDKGQFADVQKAFVNRLFEGQSTPYNNLAQNLKKFGDETLNVALPRKTVGSLKKFAELAKTVKVAEQIGGNPSGTAQNLMTTGSLTGLGYLAAHNPLLAIGAAAAPPAAAGAYLSRPLSKIISGGIKGPSEMVSKAGGAALGAILAARRKSKKEK